MSGFFEPSRMGMIVDDEIKQKYYQKNADAYDSMHQGDGRSLCINYISMFISLWGLTSICDVGCGTGSGMKQIMDGHPDLSAHGIEPIDAMLGQAIEGNNIPKEILVRGVGEALPFKDNSFDAVYAVAVLHHVRNPDSVVKEMLRVGRNAVFLADNNRFGHGTTLKKWVKLLLYKLGLWNLVRYIQTKGKYYTITDGDGLAYSYSVYDSYDCVSQWADEVIILPIVSSTDSNQAKAKSWLTPLLTSSGALLCAFKK